MSRKIGIKEFLSPYITLDSLITGKGGTIMTVGGEKELRRRLLDMGLTPKTHVFLKKSAPLGDPIELTLRGYELTIRKSDASHIRLVPD